MFLVLTNIKRNVKIRINFNKVIAYRAYKDGETKISYVHHYSVDYVKETPEQIDTMLREASLYVSRIN